jgi:hypothetical protein
VIKNLVSVLTCVATLCGAYTAEKVIEVLPGLGKNVFLPLEKEKVLPVLGFVNEFSNKQIKVIDDNVLLGTVLEEGFTLTINEGSDNLILSGLIYAPKHHIVVRAHNAVLQGCIIGLSIDVKTTGSFAVYPREIKSAQFDEKSVSEISNMIQASIITGEKVYPTGFLGSLGDLNIKTDVDSLVLGGVIKGVGNLNMKSERDILSCGLLSTKSS